jgi:hypothetical protein
MNKAHRLQFDVTVIASALLVAASIYAGGFFIGDACVS